MPTYTATGAAATVQPRSGLHTDSVAEVYAITTAFVLNDVVRMIKVCKGMTILDVKCACDDMDSSTGFVFVVGDGDDEDRFILISTVGQTGGVALLTNRVGLGYTYTQDDTIDFKVTTAASGTPAPTGNIVLTVIYTMQPTF